VTITKNNSLYVDFLQKMTVIEDGMTETRLERSVWPATVENVGLLINAARDTTENRVFIVIKADAGCRFKVIDAVMKNMQANNINRFLLITNNEADRGSGDYSGEGR
jgi:biopolymer transport protein ExbD